MGSWDKGVSQLSLGEMATIRMLVAEASWVKTGIPGLIPPNEEQTEEEETSSRRSMFTAMQ